MEIYRWVLVGISSASVLVSFLLAGLVYRYRTEKIVRASSPSLLYLVLAGCTILQIEAIMTSFPVSDVMCAVVPWLLHLGFVIMYGALLLKTWRISVIVRVFKARLFRTKDNELLLRLGMALLGSILYLSVWTATLRSKPVYGDKAAVSCTFVWPDILAMTVESLLLIWGGCLCYQARKAPDLYNETRQVSFTLWNQALWAVFYVFSRIVLGRHPDGDMFTILHFLYVHSTVFVSMSILLLPKFFVIFRHSRELHGTLTDVYGARKVHRLSLVVNKKGEVRTIYCQPCGPLYLENNNDQSAYLSPDVSEEKIRENHYTMAEVDKLIELVSSLKAERNLYSLQVQRLINLLHANNVLIPSDMITEIQVNNDEVDLCNPPQCDIIPPPYTPKPHSEEEAATAATATAAALRKQSTATTTYMSSEQGYGSLTTAQNSPRHLLTLGKGSSPRHFMYTLGADSKLTPSLAGYKGNGHISSNLISQCPLRVQPLHVSSKMLLQPGHQYNAASGSEHELEEAGGSSVPSQCTADFPRILNSTESAQKSQGPGKMSKQSELLELAQIEGKSFSPNCYRKKVFLQQKIGENSDRANFVLFI